MGVLLLLLLVYINTHRGPPQTLYCCVRSHTLSPRMAAQTHTRTRVIIATPVLNRKPVSLYLLTRTPICICKHKRIRAVHKHHGHKPTHKTRRHDRARLGIYSKNCHTSLNMNIFAHAFVVRWCASVCASACLNFRPCQGIMLMSRARSFSICHTYTYTTTLWHMYTHTHISIYPEQTPI